MRTLPPRVHYWDDLTPDRQRAFLQHVNPRILKAGVDTDSPAFGLFSDPQNPTRGSLENYLRHRNREEGVPDLTPEVYKEALGLLFERPWRYRTKEGVGTESLRSGHAPPTKPASVRAPLGIPFLSPREVEAPPSVGGTSGVVADHRGERGSPGAVVHPTAPSAAPVRPAADSLPPWSEEHRETGEALEDVIAQYEKMSTFAPPEEPSNGHSHEIDFLIDLLAAAKAARIAGLSQPEILTRLYAEFDLSAWNMAGVARLVQRVAG